MLLRSVTGELSEAMRCIQNKYVRWFNRSRRRDGSLIRGRFLSRNIDSQPSFRGWIESQLSRRLPEELQDVSLRYAGSPRTLRWMMKKAYLADNSKPFRPVALPGAVDYILRKAKKKLGALLGHLKRSSRTAWIAMRAGLLRKLAGCTLREIGMRAGRPTSTTFLDVKDHVALCKSSRDYATLASTLGNRVLNATR